MATPALRSKSEDWVLFDRRGSVGQAQEDTLLLFMMLEVGGRRVVGGGWRATAGGNSMR